MNSTAIRKQARLCALGVFLAATAVVGGCSPGKQSFSCEPDISPKSDEDAAAYTRPATRNAQGYLHC